jgi:MFS family permease
VADHGRDPLTPYKIGNVSGPRRQPPTTYLALVMGIGPLVHYGTSALGPLIVDALGLSATQFGLLWVATFGTAAAFTIAAGRAADRFGARSMLVGVFVISTAALVLAGAAWSYAWLLLALALSGAAQSLCNPATNRLIASHVPPRRQGLVLGLKQSGVQVSQLLAGLALPPIALLVGWRTALGIGAVIGVAGVVLTLVLVPRTPPSRRRSATVRAPLDGIVWWLTAYGFLVGAVTQATNVYLPLYAHQELGASVTQAGLVTAVLGGFAVLARFVWGHRAGTVHDLRRILTSLAACTALALVAILLAEPVSDWLLWLGAALFSCTALAANVIVMLAVVRSVRPESIGRSSGWASLGLFLGFMAGPLSTGLVVDHVGYAAAWSMLLGVTIALTALSVLWMRLVVSETVPGPSAAPAAP